MDTQYFDFGRALRFLRVNARVARKGWNGKGMFLVLVPGSQGLTVDEGRPLAKAGVPVGTKFNYLPHIDMYTAQGDFVPWLASQTDVLAEDWFVLDASADHPVHADIAAMNHTPTVQLRSGDTVRLKSGGPEMLVESVSGSNALCSWETGRTGGRSNFDVAALYIVRRSGA